MGRIRLTGATSGYTELRAANAAGNNTITLPTTSGGEVIVSDSSGNVNIDGDTLYVDATNNRVGIGTSTPFTVFNSYKTITGGNPATSGTTDDNVIARIQGGSVGLDIGGTPSGLQWIQPRSVNSFATNYGLAICPNGGNVGIGTSTPSALLHTAGNALFVNSGDNLDISLDSTYSTVIDAQLTGASEQLVLRTNRAIRFDTGGSTERARIDSSGRLLVGTSSARSNIDGSNTPQTQFEGVGYPGASFSITRNSADAGGPVFYFAKTRSGSIGGITAAQANDTLGSFVWTGSDGTGTIKAAAVESFVDGTPGTNDMPGRLVFSTTQDGSSSLTERMRIDNTGNFFVFSSGSDTVVGGNAAGSGTSQSVFTGVHSRTSTTGGGTVCYRIYNNGTTFSISDARQKKNIETARNGYLEDLQQLRIVKYNWLDQDDSESKELGLIAQEVAEVFPGLVQSADSSDPESTLGIKSSVFSYMLIKALQEAAEKIQSLEARLSALESA